MKRVLLLLTVALIGFTSCDKDEMLDPSIQPTAEQADFDAILGHWVNAKSLEGMAVGVSRIELSSKDLFDFTRFYPQAAPIYSGVIINAGGATVIGRGTTLTENLVYKFTDFRGDLDIYLISGDSRTGKLNDDVVVYFTIID